MIGNVVFPGFALAGADGLPVLASVVSMAAFLVGALAGGAALRSGPRILSVLAIFLGALAGAALLAHTGLVLVLVLTLVLLVVTSAAARRLSASDGPRVKPQA
ncbi:hypothetical protein OHA19_33915 [Streptomyces sp. NBC_00012]|uniref:hypothetical protein n=1 Tax=Streptomyces sp. NBC_00012 TaxID=2975621 RepID=UPI00324C0990